MYQPNKRMPVAKKKHCCTNSFRYTQRVKVEGNRVYLPKLGWFGFHKSRDIIGKIKNTTVSYHDGHWYVSFQTEYKRADRPHRSSSMTGVDLGAKRLATLSSGYYVDGLDNLRKHQDKLAKLQRSLAKTVRFSANWKKAKAQIIRLHARFGRCRRDFLHKFSSYLSKNHAVFVFEDLNVSGMSSSAKGTIDEPGRQIKQKAGLNKAILDQGWSMLVDFCKYKQKWKKGEVLKVPAPFTSQTCSECDHVDKANRTEQAVFHCVACGGAGLPAPAKQEPGSPVMAKRLVFI